MKHRTFLWNLFFSMALLAGCATPPPPSAQGVHLFLQEDYAAASMELAPLAERGDPTAQYYTGLMRLKGVSANPDTLTEAVDLIVASARAGNNEALALIVVLSMNDRQRRAFARASYAQLAPLNEGVMADGTYFSNKSVNLNRRSFRLAENAAKGPVSLPLLTFMGLAIRGVDSWPPEHQALSVSDETLLDVDLARAERNDKYAAARLANRHKRGLGVEVSPVLAFEWNMKAARSSPPPRNCVYQAPVGGGASSVYCYDAGAASAGVPKAMLELCRAYAGGVGVAKDARQAIRWCNNAAEYDRWRDDAQSILSGL